MEPCRAFAHCSSAAGGRCRFRWSFMADSSRVNKGIKGRGEEPKIWTALDDDSEAGMWPSFAYGRIYLITKVYRIYLLLWRGGFSEEVSPFSLRSLLSHSGHKFPISRLIKAMVL